MPIEQKRIQGTVNTTRESDKAEPTYEGAQLGRYNAETGEVTYPVAPSDLSKKAKGVWDRNCYQIARMELFSNSSLEYLHTYCRLFDISEKALNDFNDAPYLYNDKGVKSINPSFKVYVTSIEKMEAIGAKFAFTPLDKTKINMKAIEGDTKTKNGRKNMGVGG